MYNQNEIFILISKYLYAQRHLIFYCRRDQEFVTRLAGDLNAQVAGVWFDQSTIQLGQKWYDEIVEGIHDCKAFMVVLSSNTTAPEIT